MMFYHTIPTCKPLEPNMLSIGTHSIYLSPDIKRSGDIAISLWFRSLCTSQPSYPSRYFGTYQRDILVLTNEIYWYLPTRYIGTYQRDILVLTNEIYWYLPTRYIGTYQRDILVLTNEIYWYLPTRYIGTYHRDILVLTYEIYWYLPTRYIGTYQNMSKVIFYTYMYMHSYLVGQEIIWPEPLTIFLHRLCKQVGK